MADSQTISVPKNEQQSPASGDSYYQIQFSLFIFFCIFCFVVDSGLYLYIKVIWSYFLVKKVLKSA
jgi:hypothetical protein